ncbi:carboxypeptidase-like regulatory domain-containing protein [Myxococcota bacterium]|nr:carboxypeptidase-like regulatory domain-containing protein [Myxococcota bacterium]MBU1380281.1 carboxypeptidase-like regulatory domain-containing protein [Myxococcota bacterium]MBU1495435.1 carboxypeptidase-like regulatory domain-containing protein [Myxococcota bacterium]
MMRNFKISFILLLLLAIAGCDDGKQTFNENVTINPTEVFGTVGGFVMDATTDAPLEGVNITVISGSTTLTAVSGADGIFSVQNVPATGSVVVLMDADGYASARQIIPFEMGTGNTPFVNPVATASPAWLVPLTGSFTVRVIDDDGRPIPSHSLMLKAGPSQIWLTDDNYINSSGQVTTYANTNALGIAMFENLPDSGSMVSNSWIEISVPDYDQDGDGYPDYSGATYSYDLRNDSSATQLIRLSRINNSALTIYDSTMPYFTNTVVIPGTYGGGERIYLNFNREVSEDTIEVELYGAEIGSPSSIITPTVQGTLVYFDLPESIVLNEKYFLRVYATTQDFYYQYEKTVPVFTHPDGTLTVSLVKEDPINPASPIIATFSQYIGNGSPGYQTWSGLDGFVYFNADINSSSITGDSASEWGYYTTDVPMTIDEEGAYWLPSVTPGQTNYSKTFRFTVPYSINPGTAVYFTFDQVSTSNYRLKTADGMSLDQIQGIMP